MNKPPIFYILFCIVSLLFSPYFILGQWNQTFQSDYKEYRKALELYEQQQYPAAKRNFNQTSNNLLLKRNSNNEFLIEDANLMEVLSILKYEGNNARINSEEFVKKMPPHHNASVAIYETIQHLFHKKEFKQATLFYENSLQIAVQEKYLNDINYKIGYSYFIQKEFERAQSVLQKSLNEKTENFYPINYYYALSCFYLGEMPEALQYFRKIEQSKRFKDYTPYYIVQILFYNGLYEEAIEEGERALKNKEIQNIIELSHIVGQSYFELGKYYEALPYLEFNNQNSPSLRLEDFFQLGYCHYKNKNYSEAISPLSKLMDDEGEMGQLAMLYLADAYLNLDQNNSARNAFKKATDLGGNKEIEEEARISFVKISYTLGFDREALQSALSFSESSLYYLEAQKLISTVLLETRDFDFAITTLEAIDNLSPVLREAYQIVTYSKGIQFYNEKEFALAKDFFAKSLNFPISNEIKAKTFFWQGQISAIEGLYQKSINEINAFFTLGKTKILSSESYLNNYANYILGYNHMRLNNYSLAKDYFEKAITALKDSRVPRNDFGLDVLLPDAILRLGDCLFKEKNYVKAAGFYQEVIEKKGRGAAYATFQKAMIKGLEGKEVDKIVLLEQLLVLYPQLEFADEVLMEISNTYLGLEKLQQASVPLIQLVNYYKNKSPYINRALLQLGLIAYNNGDLESALSYYKEVYNYNPTAEESQEALKGIEEILLDKKAKPSEYILFLESLPGLTVSNRQKDSLNYKSARTQYENGEFLVAIKSLKNYLNDYPQGLFGLDALYMIGESHLLLNNYNSALEFFEKVIEKGPSSYYESASEKSAIIVSTYPAALDYTKALQYYSILDQIASNPDKRYRAKKGGLKAAFEIKDLENVKEFAEKIIESPNKLPLDVMNAYFLRGKTYYAFNNYDKALEDLNHLIELDNTEKSAEARYLICEIYFQRGDYETTEILINSANRENSSYPFWIAKSLLLYSKILSHKGDYFNALAAVEAVIENFREDKEILEQAIQTFEELKKLKDDNSRIKSPANDDLLEVQDQN